MRNESELFVECVRKMLHRKTIELGNEEGDNKKDGKDFYFPFAFLLESFSLSAAFSVGSANGSSLFPSWTIGAIMLTNSS